MKIYFFCFKKKYTSPLRKNTEVYMHLRVSQVALVVKNLPGNAGDIRDVGRSLGQEDARKRAWKLTAVFSPAESHGQKSPKGYTP